MTSIVLTILANDRLGLVREISALVSSHSGNWVDSKMSRLAGRFAGLVHIQVRQDNLAKLVSALKDLSSENIQIQIDKNLDNTIEESTDESIIVELLGQDREGIIEDISHQLAILGVNIVELSSEQRVASMSNEILFFAEINIILPSTVSAEDVQTQLEEMSDQLMVDISFT